MMNKWLLLVVMAFALCACQNPAGNSDKASAEDVVNQQSDADVVASRVQEIYSAVFKVYNEEDSLRNLDIQMENGSWESRGKFNSDYCSKEWNALLTKVNETDSLYHSGEMGFWEADYWIMGQDWHELSISDVDVLSVTPGEAAVQFQLHNLGTTKPVALMLVNEDGVWKIDNFLDVDSDMDWKRAMKEYVSKNS